MSELQAQFDRIAGRVFNVIEAIDRGEDPQPAIDRMAAAAPWDAAAIGLAATKDAIDRTNEADNELNPAQ